ncbi:hypothetical protein [Xenorhabdus hominickii]|uniref:Uncharacterized protein n=1 Tax=Xenorhabdus hominickii TaxID=351679 RepID=A0A1V0M4R8_XENHO|nr:hypothetical protein [Xenorhabdus hominickii]ARD69873.1 hypothetical protein [Xenorhabdus hominickii]PHM51607.1 hypothetical protein Xhom_04899 [Xenorhabdus hominickii]
MKAPNGLGWIITLERIEDLEKQYNSPCYSPMTNELFTRFIMREYPVTIDPIVAVNGTLVGQWRVASNGASAGINVTTAFQHKLPEFCVTQSESMTEAIVHNGLMQAGIGRMAYLYFQHDMDSYDVVFISPQIAEVIKQEPAFWAYCVRVAELDQYAVIGVPQEAELLAVENAKLVLVAQVAEYKRDSTSESDGGILSQEGVKSN